MRFEARATYTGNHKHLEPAFTVIELLVVMLIILILAALLFPALSRAKRSAQKAACINNERQINLAVLLYAEDNAGMGSTNNQIYFTYKDLIQSYIGRSGNVTTNQDLFTCPADNFNLDVIIGNWFVACGFTNVHGTGFYRQQFTHYSSYALNESVRHGPGAPTNSEVGAASLKALSYVREPARTVLLGEMSGCTGLSAHNRKGPFQFQNAENVMSFVDGHVDYIKIYWNGRPGPPGMPWFYEPPAGYDYKWSPN
jgi:type II secretory pathway pseudopilin PulG